MNKASVAVIVVVVAGASFFGGMKYSDAKTASAQQARIGQFASRTGGGNGAIRTGGNGGGGATAGEIISKDDKSITVRARDNSSKIVFLSGSVEVSKMISGTSTDLEIGRTVTVTGTTNSDGSVTAQMIQLRPAFPSPSASPAK